MSEENEYPEAWKERVGKFADSVKKTTTEITEALKGQIGEPVDEASTNEALEILSDKEALPDSVIVSALSGLGIPEAKLRKNVKLLRGEAAKQAVETSSTGMQMADILPPVPDDGSFLEMLKVGGVLKIGSTEIISAIKAALANRVGLYRLPDKLVDAMERQADQLDEPAPQSYYELLNMLTRRNYAEVLSVLNIKGQYVSEARKKALLGRLEGGLWVALWDFQKQLVAWQDAWMKGAANPAAMMAAFAAIAGGGGGIPAGMIQPPDTSPIRDAAESVINQINKVFAGPGIPVSRALAYDALQIKKALEDERLPAAVGAVNREQMLKMLGVDVASDYVRLERNVTKYIMAIMELPNVPAGQSELTYLTAMITLGVSIPWDRLVGGEANRSERMSRERRTLRTEDRQEF